MYDYKRIISSGSTKKRSYFNYSSPSSDLDLEDSNSIFLHDIPVYEDAPQYYIWFQKVEQFRRHSCLEKNLDTKTHIQTQ